MKGRFLIPVLLGLLLQALPGVALAQTGKLAGTVTDADSGDPLPGVTVIIDGTTQGSATDVAGRYTIIGLTPGVYDVRFSFVGFSTQIVNDIRVTSSRTTTLDAALQSGVVEGGEIIVESVRPVVDQNQTTSRALVTGEELAALPVRSVQDVIGKTANSYSGFIRGSRRFEAKTLVEGVDVSDSFYSLSAGSNYEGRIYSNANRSEEQSASILNLSPDNIAEVTVNAGATDPQYNAGSGGVVAVTLAERRGPITGSASFRVAPKINRPGPDSLDFYVDGADYFTERDIVAAADPVKAALYTWSDDKYAIGDDPEYDFRLSLGGSVTDNWTFGLSGQFFQSNGYLPNYFRKRINGQLKTSYNISPNTKITAVGLIEDNGLWGGWNNRNYMEFWRFYLEGVAQQDGGSYMGSVKLTQVFSENAYVTAQVYRTSNQNRYGYVDDNGNGFTDPGENGDFLDFTDQSVVDRYVSTQADREANGRENDKMFVDIVTDNFSETQINLPEGTRYRLARPAPFSEDLKQTTNGVRVDYVNQITFNHLIQAGVEFKTRNFDYQVINGLPGPGAILNDAAEPFRLSAYERSPTEFGLYVGDRMEYAGLVVNLGLRVNFANRDMEKIEDHYFPFSRDTVSIGGRELARNNIVRGESVPTDVLWNPSIGVSHPIGTNASMYFSFSRSAQLQPFRDMYQFYDGVHTTSRFFNLVDPEMDPITSLNYELGLQWEVSPGWGLDMNAYTRSIDNYSNVTFVAFSRPGVTRIPGFDRYTYQTNLGYADARGIELVLRRAPLRLSEDVSLGLTASYTFSTVERSNTTGINVRDYRITDENPDDTQLPFEDSSDFQNFPQNVRGGSTITGGYDRRHRVILRGTSTLPLDISLGLLATLESGFQYPKAIGADPRDRELLTAPANAQIDFRAEKRFSFAQRFGVDVYVDVINLLGRDNIVAFESYTPSGPARFQETGIPGERLILRDGVSLYGPARTVFFGSRLRF